MLISLVLHRSLSIALAVVTFGLLITTSANAQSKKYTDNKPDQALKSEARVDPSTLGMSLEIPFGGAPGRAGNSVASVMRYSSKQWRVKYAGGFQGNILFHVWTLPRFSENATAGWTSSVDAPWIEYTGRNQKYDENGFPLSDNPEVENYWACYIPRIHLHLPDGSSHELRQSDTPQCLDITEPPPSFSGNFYSTDGSRMWFDATAGVLYLPDGGRYWFGAEQTVLRYNNEQKIGRWATQYRDRNGNKLAYTFTNVTDTLGRVYANPLAEDNPTAGDQIYSVPGVGGQNLSYTVRWRNLTDVLSAGALSYTSNQKCLGPNLYQAVSPYLFTSGSQTHVCADTNLFNPVVLAEVELPNGQKYQFKYNVFGEMDKIIYPTGGYERFRYDAIPTLAYPSPPYDQANRGVVERWVSPSGNGSEESTHHWTYSASSSPRRITGPDGASTELYLHGSSSVSSFGFETPTAGMSYDERTYNATGQMLRRSLTEWATQIPSGSTQPRNPHVIKTVNVILDTGGNALATTRTTQYDADLNPISTSAYDFASVAAATGQTGAISAIPNGALVRTEETTFLVNDTSISSTTRQAYRDRNLIALPTSTRVKNAAGTVVAQGEIKYDEAAYSPLTYGAVTGWVDPATTIRGMATTTRSWLNPGGTWLETHTQYDQCGSPRKTWDARGYLSEVEYSSTYKYAYPTRTVSADPDGAGSGASLITTAVYDFTSGVTTSSTDANSQTSTLQYAATDTLGNSNQLQRLTKVIRPDVGWTAYGYSYTPGNLFMVTKTALDATSNTEATEYFDGLGRTWRTEQSEGATSIYTDLQYDSMGRNWKISNPYRTGTALWTTNTYDALGRVLTVKTPDNATVTTSYSGNTVTVTDQAGKKRKSVTDALGRLQEVYEDPTTLNYLTSYDYDVLDNLITVTQGVQTRTFVYDSLSRLKSAANPETGTVNYTHDNNSNLLTKVDARSITTTFTYDGLNRPTLKNYSDTTADVRYFYDAQALPAGAPSFVRGSSLGRLVAVTTGGTSEGTYRGYDIMGHVVRQYQRTDSINYLVEATYDLAGSLETQTYPSVPGAGDRRTVSYTSDAAGRVASLNSGATSYAPGASVSAIGYAPHNALTTETYGNNLVHAITYNNRLQPTAIKLGTTAAPTSKVSLTYNYGTTTNSGNVQSITYAGGGLSYTQTFGYDALNRLTTSQEGATWSQTNSYDRYGNRAIVGAALSFNASNNRITNAGYIYDAAGNLTNDSTQAFAYDAENKITKVDNVSSYVYDGEGNRVRKLLGENLRFIYGVGGQLIAEFSGATGALQKEYIYGASSLVATIEPTAVNANGTRYTTSDHLGSPRVVTSSAAAVVSRHDYKPFGEEIGAGIGARTAGMGYVGVTDGVRQKFTSKERDNETGLDYFLARYYSSTQGRFTSVDPLMASGSTGSPQSWNRYSYAYNNPLRFTDPSGMLAGDFYNEDGKRLGTDGLNDGRVYVVTDQAQAKQIQQTDKNKGTTQVSAVSSAVELPSAYVRGEMGAAVERSNSPTQDDKKGGFHEEGGTFGTTASGQEKVVNAVPGAYSDPRVPGGSATIDTSNPANPSEAGILTSVSGTFHVHPKGEITTTTGPAARPGVIVMGGTVTTTTANFNQPPSAVDIQNAQTRGISNNIVLGARSKTVYVYGGAGVRATFPLKQFLNIGRK